MSIPEYTAHSAPVIDRIARSIASTTSARLSRRRALIGMVGVSTALIAPAMYRDRSANASAGSALNDAVTAEGLLVTLLGVARTKSTDLILDEQTVRLLRAAQCEDEAHFNNLVSLGGSPTTGTYTIPPAVFTDAATFLATWVELKRILVGLYLSAGRAFGLEDQYDLVEVAFQIGTVEAQHYALLRQFLGERLPADRAFPEWQFGQTGEAIDAIAGLGFIGGVGDEVDFPGPGDRYCRGITGLVSETTSDQTPPDVTPDPNTGTPGAIDATPHTDGASPVADDE